MKKCTLALDAPGLKVRDKRWVSHDVFSENAAAGRQSMFTALGHLKQKLR